MKNSGANFSTFRLDCGVTVQLDELVQWRTYSGWLAGYPTKEINQKKIERAKTTAAAKLSIHSFVCLLTPQITQVVIGSPPGGVKKYPKLPNITCGAVLVSDAARDAKKDFSALTLLWFQDEWALPINPVIMKQVVNLDWLELATDYDF